MPQFANKLQSAVENIWDFAASTLSTIGSLLGLTNADARGSTCNGTNRSNRPGERCGINLNPKKRRAIIRRLETMVPQHPHKWLDMGDLHQLAEDALCTRYHGKVGGEHSQIEEVAERCYRMILEYCKRIEAIPIPTENRNAGRDERVRQWLLSMVDDEFDPLSLSAQEISPTTSIETANTSQHTEYTDSLVHQGRLEADAASDPAVAVLPVAQDAPAGHPTQIQSGPAPASRRNLESSPPTARPGPAGGTGLGPGMINLDMSQPTVQTAAMTTIRAAASSLTSVDTPTVVQQHSEHDRGEAGAPGTLAGTVSLSNDRKENKEVDEELEGNDGHSASGDDSSRLVSTMRRVEHLLGGRHWWWLSSAILGLLGLWYLVG